MAKTFREVFEEIQAGVTKSKTGKPVKSFSRADFDRLGKAFLNEVDYVVNVVVGADGENVTTKEVKPVEQFRGMIKRILLDFGVDKQEAERVMSSAYEIKNVDGLYELCAELVYQYADAGKKFDFLTREDFKGSLTLKGVEASSKQHKVVGTGELITVSKKAHKVLNAKSKTPDWLKKRQK